MAEAPPVKNYLSAEFLKHFCKDENVVVITGNIGNWVKMFLLMFKAIHKGVVHHWSPGEPIPSVKRGKRRIFIVDDSNWEDVHKTIPSEDLMISEYIMARMLARANTKIQINNSRVRRDYLTNARIWSSQPDAEAVRLFKEANAVMVDSPRDGATHLYYPDMGSGPAPIPTTLRHYPWDELLEAFGNNAVVVGMDFLNALKERFKVVYTSEVIYSQQEIKGGGSAGADTDQETDGGPALVEKEQENEGGSAHAHMENEKEGDPVRTEKEREMGEDSVRVENDHDTDGDSASVENEQELEEPNGPRREPDFIIGPEDKRLLYGMRLYVPPSIDKTNLLLLSEVVSVLGCHTVTSINVGTVILINDLPGENADADYGDGEAQLIKQFGCIALNLSFLLHFEEWRTKSCPLPTTAFPQVLPQRLPFYRIEEKNLKGYLIKVVGVKSKVIGKLRRYLGRGLIGITDDDRLADTIICTGLSTYPNSERVRNMTCVEYTLRHGPHVDCPRSHIPPYIPIGVTQCYQGHHFLCPCSQAARKIEGQMAWDSMVLLGAEPFPALITTTDLLKKLQQPNTFIVWDGTTNWNLIKSAIEQANSLNTPPRVFHRDIMYDIVGMGREEAEKAHRITLENFEQVITSGVKEEDALPIQEFEVWLKGKKIDPSLKFPKRVEPSQPSHSFGLERLSLSQIFLDFQESMERKRSLQRRKVQDSGKRVEGKSGGTAMKSGAEAQNTADGEKMDGDTSPSALTPAPQRCLAVRKRASVLASSSSSTKKQKRVSFADDKESSCTRGGMIEERNREEQGNDDITVDKEVHQNGDKTSQDPLNDNCPEDTYSVEGIQLPASSPPITAIGGRLVDDRTNLRPTQNSTTVLAPKAPGESPTGTTVPPAIFPIPLPSNPIQPSPQQVLVNQSSACKQGNTHVTVEQNDELTTADQAHLLSTLDLLDCSVLEEIDKFIGSYPLCDNQISFLTDLGKDFEMESNLPPINDMLQRQSNEQVQDQPSEMSMTDPGAASGSTRRSSSETPNMIQLNHHNNTHGESAVQREPERVLQSEDGNVQNVENVSTECNSASGASMPQTESTTLRTILPTELEPTIFPNPSLLHIPMNIPIPALQSAISFLGNGVGGAFNRYFHGQAVSSVSLNESFMVESSVGGWPSPIFQPTTNQVFIIHPTTTTNQISPLANPVQIKRNIQRMLGNSYNSLRETGVLESTPLGPLRQENERFYYVLQHLAERLYGFMNEVQATITFDAAEFYNMEQTYGIYGFVHSNINSIQLPIMVAAINFSICEQELLQWCSNVQVNILDLLKSCGLQPTVVESVLEEGTKVLNYVVPNGFEENVIVADIKHFTNKRIAVHLYTNLLVCLKKVCYLSSGYYNTQAMVLCQCNNATCPAKNLSLAARKLRVEISTLDQYKENPILMTCENDGSLQLLRNAGNGRANHRRTIPATEIPSLDLNRELLLRDEEITTRGCKCSIICGDCRVNFGGPDVTITGEVRHPARLGCKYLFCRNRSNEPLFILKTPRLSLLSDENLVDN